MNAIDIVALLESITESDTETAIDYSVDIANYIRTQRPPSDVVDDVSHWTLLLTALYKLGKMDAGRPSSADIEPGRPIFRGRYPT